MKPVPDPYEQMAAALKAIIADAVAEGVARALGSAGAVDSGPAMVSVPDAAERLGLGITKTKELIALGQIASRLVGRRRLIPVAALDAFAASDHAA